MTAHPSILLIEDSPGECELFRAALEKTGLDVTLHTEQDTEAAFRFLESVWMAPAMVQLRPSSEVLLRARAPGAQDHAGVVHLGRSASTGNQSGLPSFILLDWHLRNQQGDGFLRRLRADHRLASIPVVIFSTSDASSDLAVAYANGANGYVVKPGLFAELVHCVGDLCRYWLDGNRTPYKIETQC